MAIKKPDAQYPPQSILVHGNSLPLPREEISYRRTWISLLRNSLPNWHIINRSFGSKTVRDLSDEGSSKNGRQLEYLNPNLCIIQLGVVECAPRLLYNREKTALSLLPSSFLREGYIKLAKRFRERSQKRARVSPSEFRDLLQRFLDRCQNNGVDKIILVQILTAGKKYQTKNQNVGRSIEEYNKILWKIALNEDIVDIMRPLADTVEEEKDIVDRLTVNDGYHLNRDGHAQLADRLLSHPSVS